jgi:hypothetical protein
MVSPIPHFDIVEAYRIRQYIELTGLGIAVVAILVGVVFNLQWIKPGKRASGPPWLISLEGLFRRVASRRRLAVVLVGALTIIIRLALLPVIPVPQPLAPDEYSYLLAAETFASGRLTNPAHPMWVHLETMHVIQHPTYMSMYPPAQGLVLAAGKLLTGSYWGGVLISTGLMCAAVCWALQAWMPPAWALLGTVLVILRVGLFTYFMESYWGGSLAALGGALVFGSVPRILKYKRARDALLLASGLLLLANTRPYEGVLFSLPVAIVLLSWLVGANRPTPSIMVKNVLLPTALALVIGFSAMGYYFWRVTGSPLRMPYQVNQQIYAASPIFIWQHLGPVPRYRQPEMRAYYEGGRSKFMELQSLTGLLREAQLRILAFLVFYIGVALVVPLIALPALVRSRRMRLSLAICTAMAVGLGLEAWWHQHYAAPGLVVFYAIVVQGMRYLRLWRLRDRPIGMFLTRGSIYTCAGLAAVLIAGHLLQLLRTTPWPIGEHERTPVAKQLQNMPGQHLVLVRTVADEDLHHEWVYNGADIDGTKIVWAHQMAPGEDEELIHYFENRRVWTVRAGIEPPRLAPYQFSESALPPREAVGK